MRYFLAQRNTSGTTIETGMVTAVGTFRFYASRVVAMLHPLAEYPTGVLGSVSPPGAGEMGALVSTDDDQQWIFKLDLEFDSYRFLFVTWKDGCEGGQLTAKHCDLLGLEHRVEIAWHWPSDTRCFSDASNDSKVTFNGAGTDDC